MTISIERVSHVQMDIGYGTWTPALQFGGAAVGMTTSDASGIYVKHGRIVFVKGHITLTAKGSSTGNVTIAGLPYSAITFGSLPTTQPCGVCPSYSDLTGITSYTNAPLGLRVSGSSLFVYAYNATASSQLQSGNFTDTSRLFFDASYIVAE